MTYNDTDNVASEGPVPDGSRVLAADAQPRAVMLGGQIDVSMLPPEQQQELVREYAQGRMDLEKRAAELNMDIAALDQSLRSFTSSAAEAHASDVAVTYSHKTESKAGRTEIVIGNTEEAARGKLPQSQRDDFNWNPAIIFAGIVGLAAVTVVALLTVGAGG